MISDVGIWSIGEPYIFLNSSPQLPVVKRTTIDAPSAQGDNNILIITQTILYTYKYSFNLYFNVRIVEKHAIHNSITEKWTGSIDLVEIRSVLCRQQILEVT